MTGPQSDQPRANAATADHPSAELLAGYALGSVDQVTGWSVEAHLTGCARCRSAVTTHVDPARLARNRDVLRVRVATTHTGPVSRVIARCGIPEHVLRLLAATPSLRRSWLLSVVGALAVLTGETALVAHLSAGPVGPHHAQGQGQVLLPFVLAAPLLVLAAVAGAFLPMFDPAYQLAVAAPFSGCTLLLVRTVSALVAALVPVVVAAFVVPGPGWLPAALLLPSLALAALALVVAVVLGPRAAVAIAVAVWAVPVLWIAAAREPLLVLSWDGQLAFAAVLVTAVAALAVRRDRLEFRWAR